MADDANLRNRRAYYHKRGDHGLCKPDRCPDAAAQEAGTEPPQSDALVVAVREVAGALPFRPGDPRRAVVALLGQLAEAVGSAPPSSKAALAREMRNLLDTLMETPPTSWDVVDELRARRAAKVVDSLLEGGVA